MDLGPFQQQVLLGVLLLHANRPLGPERLIDAVWGSSPPVSAANSLQKYVSALRRALEPARAGRGQSRLLPWTGVGYQLNVAASDLDVHVFDEGVARARVMHAGGDRRGAARLMHTALRLWRGPPYDGLANPALDAERERLSERKVSVVEDRIDLDLALGSHADLITELRQLVATHPLRERLRGLLMLALYRAGRQAEAIAAFQEAHRHLSDELGVEPGPQLQRLHQQILAADPGLAVAAVERDVVASTGGRPPVPAQLPHAMPEFTGRRAELDRLHALLAGAGGNGRAGLVTTVSGTAGVGKTALAVHWAHQVRDRFPDGQLFLNLRGFDPSGSTVEPAEALRVFLEAFDVPSRVVPAGLDARAGLYRTLLTDRRVLILLDNARSAEQVRPLLPGSPGCLVLVTSRNELSGLVATEGAQPIDLDLMSAAEAQQLLVHRLGTRRVEAEPRAVDEIVTRCAGLPLALAIAGARAATHGGFPLAALADQLRAARGSLDAFDSEDVATDVRAIFSWSYQTLDPAVACAFRLLGLHAAADVTVPVMASLAGTSRRAARRMLATLAGANLVTEYTPGRFGLHDLLRAYAAERVEQDDSADARRAALHRLLDHWLHSAHAADHLLNPHREPITPAAPQPGVQPETFADREQALAWFTAEHRGLLAAVDLAASAGFDTHTWQLAWTLNTFFDRRGHWYDSLAAQQTALEAGQRLGDEWAQAGAHRALARSSIQLGQYRVVDHLERALELYRALDNHGGQGRTLLNLAHVCERQGQHRRALEHASRAVDMFRTAGLRAGQADALNAVGWYHAKLGRHQRALAYCEQALALHQETGDEDGEAYTWDSLGYIHHRLGSRQQALHGYQCVVRLRRGLGDRYLEAVALDRLGDVHRSGGELEPARAAWQAAVKLLDEVGRAEAEQVRAKLHELRGDG